MCGHVIGQVCGKDFFGSEEDVRALAQSPSRLGAYLGVRIDALDTSLDLTMYNLYMSSASAMRQWRRRLRRKLPMCTRHRRDYASRVRSSQVKSSQVVHARRLALRATSGLHGGQPTSERSLVGGVDSALRQRIQAKPQHAARRYM